MPANINIDPNIALGVKQTDPMTNIGNMLNTASALQNFQQTQQANPLLLERQQQLTEQGRYTTQKAAQENQERIATQRFISNPENWQTDGRIDIDKINSTLPQIAPLTGDAIISRLTLLGDAQTKGIEAKQKLTTEQRAIIAGPLDILGRLGVNDPKTYTKELELLKKKNPHNRDLHQLIDSQIEIISHVPEGTNLSQAAIRGSQELLSPTEKETAFSPKSSLLNTGPSLVPAVTTPSIGGNAPNIKVGGGAEIPVGINPANRYVATGRVDQNNQPTAFEYAPNGDLLGEVTIPAINRNTQRPPMPGNQTNVNAPAAPVSNAPVRLRPGETAETLKLANEIRTNSSKAALTVPNQQFNNNEIIKIADKVATGAGAEVLGNLSGGYALIPFTSDNAENLNKLGHYMALQTAELAKSAGVNNTNAGQALAGEISSTTQWTQGAIKSTARVNRALSTATNLFNQGIQNSFNKTKDPFSANDFQNKWSQVADINAIRFADAKNNKDIEGMREILSSVNALDKNGNIDVNSQGYKGLINKIKFMRNLVNKGE